MATGPIRFSRKVSRREALIYLGKGTQTLPHEISPGKISTPEPLKDVLRCLCSSHVKIANYFSNPLEYKIECVLSLSHIISI